MFVDRNGELEKYICLALVKVDGTVCPRDRQLHPP